MPVFLKRNPLLDVTAVSNVFLLEYMPKAPEGFTKAYLLGLMQTGAPGAEAAGLDVSGVLGVSETELARAFAYWQTRRSLWNTSRRALPPGLPPGMRRANMLRL